METQNKYDLIENPILRYIFWIEKENKSGIFLVSIWLLAHKNCKKIGNN